MVLLHSKYCVGKWLRRPVSIGNILEDWMSLQARRGGGWGSASIDNTLSLAGWHSPLSIGIYCVLIGPLSIPTMYAIFPLILIRRRLALRGLGRHCRRLRGAWRRARATTLLPRRDNQTTTPTLTTFGYHHTIPLRKQSKTVRIPV